MPDPITPALTAASGYKVGEVIVCEACGQSFGDDAAFSAHAQSVHPMALGFTWEDVELLMLVKARLQPHKMADLDDERERLTALADRIAALLPPRQTAGDIAAHDLAQRSALDVAFPPPRQGT